MSMKPRSSLSGCTDFGYENSTFNDKRNFRARYFRRFRFYGSNVRDLITGNKIVIKF